MYVCEYCGKEHDGTYGSGRFCSPSCSRKYSNTFVDDDARKRQIEALNDPENRRKNVEARNKKKKKKTYKDPTSIFGKDSLPFSRMVIGQIGEMRTSAEFGTRGFNVYTPVFNDSTVDMVVDLNGNMKKIQVKSTTVSNGDVSIFGLKSNNERFGKDGIKRDYSKSYSKDEIDYFALYDYVDDEVFLMKNNTDKRSLRLRKSKPKNNNNDNTVNYKRDYKFDKVLFDMLLEDVPEGFTVLRDRIIDDD